MRNIFARKSAPPQIIHDEQPRPNFGLGLMGGGSWGAFTAGVLEELVPVLETIGQITAISGTSAGAVNGVLLTSGLNDGGAHEGVRRVNEIWDRLKQSGAILDLTRGFADCLPRWMIPTDERWPNYPKACFNMAACVQALNPLMTTGATQMISGMVKDIVPNWKSAQTGRVVFSANTVRRHNLTGEEEHIILSGKNLTPNGVGASANLRELGTHQILDHRNPFTFLKELSYTYLDGGYEQNPPLQPLLDARPTDIFMIILHDHQSEDNQPRYGKKLYHDEIHRDVASLALDDSNLMRIHAIEIEMSGGEINGWRLNDTSKFNTSPEFIDALHEAGRAAAKKWLTHNLPYLGVESTYRPHSHAVQQLIAAGFNY